MMHHINHTLSRIKEMVYFQNNSKYVVFVVDLKVEVTSCVLVRPLKKTIQTKNVMVSVFLGANVKDVLYSD